MIVVLLLEFTSCAQNKRRELTGASKGFDAVERKPDDQHDSQTAKEEFEHEALNPAESDLKRDSGSISAKYLPKNNKVLLILGQDLTSVRDYVNCGYFSDLGGVTTYFSFYNIIGSAFPAYGTLGQDVKGNPVVFDVDWGAGPLNAQNAAFGYPNSAMVIGLSIAEGNNQALWATGELANMGAEAHEDKIRGLAKFCKDIRIPVFLRIGYEFNGAWNKGYENTTNYIHAFRRIAVIGD
jgi:hypothetical protein